MYFGSYFHIGHGLANHAQNNVFKILRIVSHVACYGNKEPQLEAKVYTLSSDSWRSVVIPEESLSHNFILCFDVNDEQFQEIMLPHHYLDGFYIVLERLVVFKGLLALIVFYASLDWSVVTEMWVMEYGVVQSWTKKSVTVDSFERFFGCVNNELLIETQKSGIVSIDLDTLNENNLGI
nr:putative f-box protein [Quercus suber]